MSYSDEVISSLKGKVIKKNENKLAYVELIQKFWKINKYFYQGESEEWTPFNAEMNMQSIKVLVKNPVPQKVQVDSSFEDTMLLLEMMKEKKQKENKKQKVWVWLDEYHHQSYVSLLQEDRIRQMAMEKKMKSQNTQYIKLTF